MLTLKTLPPQPRATVNRGRYLGLVTRFLALWLFFMFLLASVALLMDINWARPRLELLMSESLKRRVALGSLSWNLGLNGLSIQTSKMGVTSLEGEPFVTAGPSEIGVAVLPLLKGKLIVRHLSFTKPEVWAVRLPAGNWNFTDLLKPGPEIRFVQVERGRLHLVDHGPGGRNAFKPYDFDNLDLKLTWPRKNRRWPLYLSFDLPRPGYTTSVKLTAFGNGLFERWQQNKYKFDLTADRLNPDDLGPLRRLIPEVGGLFALDVSGEGALNKGILLTASARIQGLSVPAGRLGVVKAPQATSSARVRIDKQAIEWDDLSVKLSDVELRSTGRLANWQGGSPDYQARVLGNLKDLRNIPWIAPAQAASAAPTGEAALARMLAPGRLSGSANIEVRLTGHGPVSRLLATIAADGLPAQDVANSGLLEGFPMLDLLGADAASRLKGQLTVADGRLELPGAEMAAAGGRLRASGFWDRAGGRSRFDFTGDGLSLSEILKRVRASGQASAHLLELLRIDSVKKLSMGGRLDLAGRVTTSGHSQSLNVSARLNDADFAVDGGGFAARGVSGKVDYDGQTLKIENVIGNLGHGNFKLNGRAVLGQRPYIDVVFTANRLDLEQFAGALRLLKIQIPAFSDRQLWGKVRDFSLVIKGSPVKPAITLAAQPEDLYYQRPGLSRPLRGVSGSLRYEGDELVLREVGLISRQGQKLVTSLAIDDLSGQARLKRVKAKTNGLDLSELNFYLSSPLMPPPLRERYLHTLSRYHVTGVSGTAYGDLLWQAGGADFDLDGVIGFSNVKMRAGTAGYPFERLSGLFAASGQELLIQDLSGSIGKTTFVLDGHVTDYRSPRATWQTELRSQVVPEDLLRFLPGLAGQLNAKIDSAAPLSFRATISGNSKASTVIFSARADGKTCLAFTGPLGSIYQPPQQPVSLDGSFTFTPGDAGSIVLHNSHLLIGDSILQGQGAYAWSPADTGALPTVRFRLTSANPVPAATLLSVVDPAAGRQGVAGTVAVDLKAEGSVAEPALAGHVDLLKVSLPQFNIHDLTGRAETNGFVLPLDLQPGSEPPVSRARLAIASATIGSLSARDVAADVVFEPAGESGQAPRVALRSGQAAVAGGKIGLNAWLDLTNHRIHLEAKLAKVQSGQVVGELLGLPGEITGVADGSVCLDSQGLDYQDLVRNLDGHGQVIVTAGKVTRFGQLQEKLTQANLLQQGLFGFNLNNLLQSVVPVRTGHFKELNGKFSIADGLLSLTELRFNGEDMRLRAAGTVNLPLNTIAIEVAGNLPRVSSSLIGGPIGHVSREITLQKLLHALTMRKLENLPSLPVLGDIASDRPRAFTFRVATTMDDRRAIAHSIEKTFRWLPNQANASAHPLPGLH